MSDVDLPDFPDWQCCSACGSRGTVEVKLTTGMGGLVIGYDMCRVCDGNGGWVIGENHDDE